MKPLWFGPDERPLFGWLHVPVDGQAFGGVLLCPSLGIEEVGAHYAYRELADRLAERGLVALRFDYDGTGDSAGREDDPGRVAAWLGSIRVAADLLRSLGLGRTGVVGMRMGATLVAEAFGSGPSVVDDLVLWDPCASGRAFLREQGALWSFTLGARSNDDGSVETPGLVYDKDTVAELSTLAVVNGDGPLAGRVLLLTRSGRKGDRRMNERLDMPHVERVVIEGQEDLIDVEPGYATVPDATVETIVEWLAHRAGAGPAVPLDPDVVGRTRAIVGRTADAAFIEERAVSLGARGLFGIMTSRRGSDGQADTSGAGSAPEDAPGERSGMPAVFFFNAGVLDHVGPARLWVRLSRAWAEAGFRSVRFDLIGLGDSPVHIGRAGEIIYGPDALDDVLDVLRDVLPDDPSNAILVGLCSGGYHAIEGAIAARARGLCAVNPGLNPRPPELLSDVPPELQAGKLDTRRQATAAKKDWTRRLPGRGLLGPMVARLPGPAWWVLNRVAISSSPARTLAKMVEIGTDVLVIVGDKEAHALYRGEGPTVRRLRRTGKLRLEVVPGLEHTLFERKGRELAAGMLTEHVLGLSANSIA